MANRFEGKVALITGAGQGMGLGYAKAIAAEGGAVVIAEFNEETGAAAQQVIQEAGGRALFAPCDVGDEVQIVATVKRTIEEFGTVDILINNAQTTAKPYRPIVEETAHAMEVAFRTGPLATFLFMRECAPFMLEKGWGRIINVCSDTGVDGMETFAAYGSAKEGIRCLTRVGAREMGKRGVTVNVVSPGAETAAAAAWRAADPEGYEKTMEPVPLGRLGSVDEDIVPGVLFLASDEGRFVTGQTLFLDGGHTFAR